MIYSIVGYGTFIIYNFWKNKRNVEICTVPNYIRIFPKGSSFPYVMPSKDSCFKALKFDVNEHELQGLDNYEGVENGLFERIEIEVLLKEKKKIKAFIYVPTKKTIFREKLNIDLDRNDLWKKEIEKNPVVIKKFPNLL